MKFTTTNKLTQIKQRFDESVLIVYSSKASNDLALASIDIKKGVHPSTSLFFLAGLTVCCILSATYLGSSLHSLVSCCHPLRLWLTVKPSSAACIDVALSRYIVSKDVILYRDLFENVNHFMVVVVSSCPLMCFLVACIVSVQCLSIRTLLKH